MRRVEWEERGCFSAATEAPSGSGSATRLIGYDLINVSLRKRNISKFEVREYVWMRTHKMDMGWDGKQRGFLAEANLQLIGSIVQESELKQSAILESTWD
ncbi:uncharacterized protein DFL_002561 [Arthrobotrys flagrans]|uniref:Uncharacterized protein n=1 Tax=Arthrobotrys flagrans TaxID=97331 RepID=A0A437AAU6_ARTFL|nr:hypothetical protein DFL_002561 [Arthrobotrys flagrans]